MPRALPQAPEELTRNRLPRLGEGIGKVVYASAHWVVKRERSPGEVVALIIIWKILRRWAHMLPFGWGDRLLSRPSKVLRFMRMITEFAIAVIPKSIWYTTHVAEVFRTYRARDIRGEKLARRHLSDTELLPEVVTFPPATVLVGGWPGWLNIREATERVEATLDGRISDLAQAGDYDRVELWLNRFLEVRQTGWQLGVFSVDAHLKNFGVIGERIVLIDAGGLTNRWSDIAARLSKEEVIEAPHVQLGLSRALAARPDVASRFDERWKSLVNRESVSRHWPEDPPHKGAGANPTARRP
jgi:hypothetical protein